MAEGWDAVLAEVGSPVSWGVLRGPAGSGVVRMERRGPAGFAARVAGGGSRGPGGERQARARVTDSGWSWYLPKRSA